MKKSFLLAVGLVPFLWLEGTNVCQAASNLVLKARTIVWQPGISPGLSNQLHQASFTGARVPAFVQFANALSPTNHQVLTNSDVRLEEYLHDSAYSVSLPSQGFMNNTNVQGLIFAAEPVLPIDKLQLPLPLNTNQLACWAYDPQNNTLRILVGFWQAADDAAIAQSLTNAGLTGVPYGADNSWAVIAPLPSITNLANELSVKTIQVGPVPFLPLNKFGRLTARTDAAQHFTYVPASAAAPKGLMATYPDPGLSGTNVRIAICDDGVDEKHNDLRHVKPDGTAGQPRFYAPRAKDSAHGTHVASIAAGNGFNFMNSNQQEPFLHRGHAPEALIGDYPNFGGSTQLFYKALNLENTDVSNHSYLQSHTRYDLIASSLDIIVRGDAKVKGPGGVLINIFPRPSVWGAGNCGVAAQYPDNPVGEEEEGYFSVYTSAKNTISVGSVDTDTGRRSTSSSCGPTFDGRIKPDLVAPGQHNANSGIVAARINTQGYEGLVGTSQAAPVVTGIIALMMQKHKTNCASATCPELPPAMYKAILIHTADDLVKTNSTDPPTLTEFPEDKGGINPDTLQPVQYGIGPDFATGYGLVNAAGACAKIVQPGCLAQGVITPTVNSQTWQMVVPAGSGPVKVVIAWDDLPAATSSVAETTPRLVNDLDLTLQEPGNLTPYKPWVAKPLDPGGSPEKGNPNPVNPLLAKANAERTEDHLNNVEMVSVDPPPPGTWPAPVSWQITVSGFKLPFGGTQPFSLVSSHPISPIIGP
jgi:subtilisin family serine protease